jgi:FHS family L-fucose permease-like MFS transporter
MVYWGGAMVGRFVGSAVLQRIKTGPVLGSAAIAACALTVLSLLSQGHLAMYALLLVGFCNSIMFPSIFTLGIQDLGPLTSKGSSLMIAAILGGAIIPYATGKLADHIGLHPAFIIPAICYIYIAGFGIAAIKRPVAQHTPAAA